MVSLFNFWERGDWWAHPKNDEPVAVRGTAPAIAGKTEWSYRQGPVRVADAMKRNCMQGCKLKKKVTLRGSEREKER